MFVTPVMPILTTLAAAAAQPVDTSPATRAQPVLHTPDSIAPAVLPYLACLYAVRGLPFLMGNDNRQIPVDKSDTDCSATKRRATADALKLLSNKSIPGGVSPNAYVENVFSEMESYVAALPVRQNNDKTKQPVIGLPMTMEDEVQPAYDQYEDCLKTQVSYTPISVDTVLAVFRQAMTICQSVRESAVIQAENSLVKKGWDASRAAKAAESTFATADQSWIALGRQFHDSLVAQANRAKR